MTAAADFDARSGGSQRTPQRPQQQHGQWKPRQQQRQRQQQCSSKSSIISVIIISSGSSGSSDGSSSYWQRSCVALPEAWIHSMMALTVADHPSNVAPRPSADWPDQASLRSVEDTDRRRRNVRFHSRTARACQPSHAPCAHTDGRARLSLLCSHFRRRHRRPQPPPLQPQPPPLQPPSLRHRRSPPAATVSCTAVVLPSRRACASRVAQRQTFCYTRVCLFVVVCVRVRRLFSFAPPTIAPTIYPLFLIQTFRFCIASTRSGARGAPVSDRSL